MTSEQAPCGVMCEMSSRPGSHLIIAIEDVDDVDEVDKACGGIMDDEQEEVVDGQLVVTCSGVTKWMKGQRRRLVTGALYLCLQIVVDTRSVSSSEM